MRTKIVIVILRALAIYLGVMLQQAHGYNRKIETKQCLRSMRHDITRLTSDAHNLEAKRTHNGQIVAIKQLVPFTDEYVDYGERLATLVIDCKKLRDGEDDPIERKRGREFYNLPIK